MMRPFISILMLLCFIHTLSAQNTEVVKRSPFVLGTTVEIRSSVLSENRVLNIYFPEGYNADDTTRYPVIYLLDGSVDEDFIHISGLVQYANFPWVNLWPRSIIVGIANVDRRRDFTFPTTIENDKKKWPTTGGSSKFIDFIEKELQPFVNKSYRTNNSRTIIGQSFAGLLAAEILYTRPALFDTYIIISPSLWWDKQSLLSKQPAVTGKSFDKKTTVFVGVGKEGEEMEGDAKKLVSSLHQSKKDNVKVFFEYFPEEDHATILHNAVYKAFKVLSGKEARK